MSNHGFTRETNNVVSQRHLKKNLVYRKHKSYFYPLWSGGGQSLFLLGGCSVVWVLLLRNECFRNVNTGNKNSSNSGENMRNSDVPSQVAWWLRLCLPMQRLWVQPLVMERRSHTCLCSAVQSGQTLCDPTDCSPPGSSVHGTLQTRILDWVAMPSSKRSSSPKDQTSVSCIGRQILYCWAKISPTKKPEHKQQRQYCNKFNNDFKNDPHKKKKS